MPQMHTESTQCPTKSSKGDPAGTSPTVSKPFRAADDYTHIYEILLWAQ